MSVLIEGISVIIRHDAVVAKFPNGLGGFLGMVPNRTFCTDGELIRVGFMSPHDVWDFVEQLEACGLVYLSDDRPIDIVVVDQKKGFIVDCPWAKVESFDLGLERHVAACSLAERSKGNRPLAIPEGWSYEGSLSHKDVFVPNDEIDERLEPVDLSKQVKVYRDKQTGELVYLGTTTPDERDEEYRAIEAVAGRILQLDAEAEQARRANHEDKAVQIYQELTEKLKSRVERLAIQAKFHCGFAHFACGLLHRVLQEREKAVEHFKQSLQYNADVENTLLEITRCLGELKRPADAEPFARRAVAVAPDSAPAWGNLAMVLINLSCRTEARHAIDKAISLDPGDQLNRYIADHFDEYFR